MSIEKLLEDVKSSLDKNTAMQAEVLAAVKANTGTMETLVEGRADAIAALTSNNDDKPAPTRKTRAKKADAEPETDKADEKKAEDKKAEPETAAKWSPDLSPDGLRAAFSPYLTGETDPDKKKARIANVSAILAEIGVETINPIEGKKALETDDDKRRALFYLERFKAGLPVDFNADYDFNADPTTQDVKAEEPADADLVG